MGTAKGRQQDACQVAVIGAGIVGTAVAARLAGAGLDVLLLDRAGPAAGASSSGEGNLLVSDKLPGAELALAKRSLQLWRRLGETAGARIELHEKGGLVVAWDEAGMAGLRSLAMAQRAEGVAAEVLSPEEVARAEPALSPVLAGGVLYPEDGQVQPMLTVELQARRFREAGGRFLRGAEVVDACRDKDGAVSELLTTLGPVRVGGWVINAAGAWSGAVARLLGGSVAVEPRKGHVLVTEPLPELVRRKVYDAGYVGSIHEEAAARAYAAVVESTPAGTMLIGSSREFAGFDGRVAAEAVQEVARRGVALVPPLAGARLMRAYVGFRPATPDRLPAIGADASVPNLLHATGHEGAGILLSQVTAEIVECLVLGREPPLDVAPFSPSRFVPPPRPAPPRSSPAVQGKAGPPAATATSRLLPGPAPSAGPLVSFSFDGRPLSAPAGMTVAGALLFNGERAWRAVRGDGRPRGLFCGIGNCFDCLADMGGPGEEKAVRACLLPVEEGARVLTSRSVGAPGRAEWPSNEAEADVAVVGGGPAGMAAATAAASRGASVVLVDSGARLGGQFFRQPLVGHPGKGGPAAAPAGLHLPDRWQRLAAGADVGLVLGAEVWSASPEGEGFVLRWTRPGRGGAGTVRSRSVVLATGASELTLPFPGWELPGVTTAGAAQSLLKSEGLLIGERVVVGGTGPFLWPVAAGLALAGAVVTVVEALPSGALPRAVPALLAHPAKLVEAAGYASTFARYGVRFLNGRAVVRAEGTKKVERAVLARLGPGWGRAAGGDETIEADAVCISHGFVPRLELTRQLDARGVADPRRPAARAAWGEGMGTSRPGLFVAGELAGVAGADVAELEGELAGHSAASYLGYRDHRTDRDREALTRRLHASRSFARRLEALYPLRQGWLGWLEDETVFCRCEDATWGMVRDAVRQGAGTVREVRNVTRCGMGYCQGRTCGPPLQLAVSALTGRCLAEVGDLHRRPVAVPVPLGQVAHPSGRKIG